MPKDLFHQHVIQMGYVNVIQMSLETNALLACQDTLDFQTAKV